MLLAVDVGNTQTVIGLYEGASLQFMWRIATDKSSTFDELMLKMTGLLQYDGIELTQVRGIALASVVPQLTASWTSASKRMLDCDPLIVGAQTASGLFRTHYCNPEEIGADRIADSVAAVALYGHPVLVVDFGTATNIEVVDREGVFLGGIIAPGMETSALALFSQAARLGAIELFDPHTAIGTTTNEAVQAGILYGEADRVDGLVRRIFGQMGYAAPVIATGGLAATVAPFSETISQVNEELTLEGLRLIYASQEK